MRRINLLPPAARRRPAGRLRGGVPAVLLIVGAVAIIAMVGVYLFFLLRLKIGRASCRERVSVYV
jgi:hypothetical protein